MTCSNSAQLMALRITKLMQKQNPTLKETNTERAINYTVLCEEDYNRSNETFRTDYHSNYLTYNIEEVQVVT